MTRYFSLPLTYLLLVASALFGQVGTINNYYQPGSPYPTYSTTTVGGQTVPSVYDYGGILNTMAQFPSPQFPSPQFPSVSTPTSSIYGYGSSIYNPGYVPVTYTQPAPVATPPLATPVGTATTLTPALTNQTIGAATLQQVYPQPAVPRPTAPQVAQAPVRPPLTLQLAPVQTVLPPERYYPGLATIKNGHWVVNDLFYGLPFNIGVKIDLLRPSDKFVPLDVVALQNRVKGILGGAGIVTEAIVYPCAPPTPIFNVIIMAYPCDRKCVGFITAQLLEPAKPSRIDVDINGVWQAVTWERQSLVVSACETFEAEVGNNLARLASEFSRVFKFYHPPVETPCFDVVGYP